MAYWTAWVWVVAVAAQLVGVGVESVRQAGVGAAASQWATALPDATGVALLLAAMLGPAIAHARSTRRGETRALAATGEVPAAVVAPALLLGLLLLAAMTLVEGVWRPGALSRRDAPAAAAWFRDRQQALVAASSSADGTRVLGVRVLEMDSRGVEFVADDFHDGLVWDGLHWRVQSSGRLLPSLRAMPSDFRTGSRDPRALTGSALRDRIRELERRGRPSLRERVVWHQRAGRMLLCSVLPALSALQAGVVVRAGTGGPRGPARAVIAGLVVVLVQAGLGPLASAGLIASWAPWTPPALAALWIAGSWLRDALLVRSAASVPWPVTP